MSIIEIVLISIGLSFDVFAVMTVEGAMLAAIEKKKLCGMAVIFCTWQLVSVTGGYLISLIPVFQHAARFLQAGWTILSTIIFFAIAAFLLYKAWKKEDIHERMQEVNFKQVITTAILVSLDAFFAGIGFGFMGANVLVVDLSLLVVTVVFVILGIYTGYRLGWEQKPAALCIGAACIIFASMDIIVTYFIL